MKKSWNFSDKLRQCLVAANELAFTNDNEKITNEHFLVALIEIGEGFGYGLLIDGPSNIKAIRKELLDTFENPVKNIQTPIDTLYYSADLKATLSDAEIIAKNIFGHDFICTEHFVLSVLRGDSRACSILSKHGFSYEETKERLDEMIYNSQAPQQGEGPSPAVSSVGKSKKRTGKETFLDVYANDLTEMARKNKLMPVIGRKKEIERIVQILGRKTKNNPALLGQPGVGKTAIVEGLAHFIAHGSPPEWLKNKRLLNLDMGALVAGTKYRGQFEERVKELLKEVKADDSIILVVDEMHTMNGAGASEGSLDASNMFKQPLARGELKIIGITTLEEYRKYIEKDKALERRFQPILVHPPTISETLDILKGIKSSFEQHHNVMYDEQAIEASVNLASRYITDRQMPDKAIDVMDETGSRVKMRFLKPEKADAYEQQLQDIQQRMNHHIESDEFEIVEELYGQYQKAEAALHDILHEWHDNMKNKNIHVTKRNVAEVVSFMTGIPVSKIDSVSTKDKLKGIRADLSKGIVGQEEAIDVVSKSVMRGLQGLKEYNKPIGSFLFLGPTGTGKTELCKVLAKCLFNDEDSFFTVDMSEFAEHHEVAKFYGAPAGYIGHEESGIFERIRRKPYCVVLLDEIEKAHPKVLNVLLQILDEGRLTDSHQNVINFKNCIIIMTSNLGVSALKAKSLGFTLNETVEGDYKEYKDKILTLAKKTLKPEFINRLDEVVVFRKLEPDDCRTIIRIIIEEHNTTFLKDRGINLTMSDRLVDHLAEVGFSEEYGGRELKRTIKRVVYDELSEYLLNISDVDMEGSDIHIAASYSEKEEKAIFTHVALDLNKVKKTEKDNIQEVALMQDER